MKKKILILFPYPFTEFTNYKFEISELKKLYNTRVIVQGLQDTYDELYPLFQKIC